MLSISVIDKYVQNVILPRSTIKTPLGHTNMYNHPTNVIQPTNSLPMDMDSAQEKYLHDTEMKAIDRGK